MSKLYLFNYNNYFNRIVKKESSLANYGTPIYTLDNTNFNYNDGVITSHDINYNGQDGDYVIITETTNNTETIVSRWFVVENKRNRGGQHKLTLRRDLIVDNYDKVMEAPIALEKGMVNYTNPLVFNDEGFSCNQIKKSETLLTDTKNGFPYIVLYMAKGFTQKQSIPVNISGYGSYDREIATTLENSIYNTGEYTSETQSMNLDFRFKAQYSTYGYTGNWRFYIYNTDAKTLVDDGGAPTYTSVITNNIISNNETQLKTPLTRALSNAHMADVLDDIKDSETSAISDADMAIYEDIISRGQLVVKDISGKFYRITARKEPISVSNVRIKSTDAGYTRLVNYIKTEFPDFVPNDDTAPADYAFYPFYTSKVSYKYYINAEYLASQTFTVDIDPSDKVLTNDSECTVLLFPYEDIHLWLPDGYSTFIYHLNKSTQMAIARAIAKEYTTSVCYDMQLLPYAPPSIQQICTGNNAMRADRLSTGQYTYFEHDNYVRGVMFWADVSSFTFDIAKTISVNKNAIDYKISSNCDTYRLCSPNYNGQFEFNAAKNDGVDSFNIDVTYRPYNPYIHINPNFKSLYGLDYNDARGLICQGDFSLPITGDAFAEYELQNKNYLNVFNREIQHMDFTNSQERITNAFQLGVGTLQGTSTGAFAGGQMGGAYGAIAGALIGGAASGIGGIVDWGMMEKRQAENKDYAIDMFNYKLGNIKALPYSLNKVTPLTFNNKIFPFIEYYSCTDEEKEALRNKITFTSMTLNVISTLNNAKTNYTEDNDKHFYKGMLIRLDDLQMCTHEAQEIYNEITKGVYI